MTKQSCWRALVVVVAVAPALQADGRGAAERRILPQQTPPAATQAQDPTPGTVVVPAGAVLNCGSVRASTSTRPRREPPSRGGLTTRS